LSLQNSLIALAALDKRVVRGLIEENWKDFKSALAEYQTMRKDIRTQLLDQPTASIADPSAVSILKRITTGAGLPTDSILNRFFSSSNQMKFTEECDDQEIDNLGSDLLYSWFSHHEYVSGLSELRPLVVAGSVGEGVIRLVREIQSCYAFQQYDATFTLCRTLIEVSIRDICVRCGLFPEMGKDVILFERFNWTQLRDRVSSGSLRDRLNSIYGELSKGVHGRKSVTKEETQKSFEETLQVVERLYATHTR
jgi:hypothetical protein